MYYVGGAGELRSGLLTLGPPAAHRSGPRLFVSFVDYESAWLSYRTSRGINLWLGRDKELFRTGVNILFTAIMPLFASMVKNRVVSCLWTSFLVFFLQRHFSAFWTELKNFWIIPGLCHYWKDPFGKPYLTRGLTTKVLLMTTALMTFALIYHSASFSRTYEGCEVKFLWNSLSFPGRKMFFRSAIPV